MIQPSTPQPPDPIGLRFLGPLAAVFAVLSALFMALDLWLVASPAADPVVISGSLLVAVFVLLWLVLDRRLIPARWAATWLAVLLTAWVVAALWVAPSPAHGAEHFFTDYGYALFAVAAFLAIIAQAIAHRRVETSLDQRRNELALLHRVSQHFAASLDLDEVLVRVLDEVRRLLAVHSCSVWLVEPETGEVVCRHSTGPGAGQVRGWRLALGQGLAGWVAAHGESENVPDARLDPRHAIRPEHQDGAGMRSILTVPLRVRQDVVGVVQVVAEEPYRFGDADLILVGSLAGTAAAAIENARLYAQARHDAATRETLLREVNHRVKNNLASIIGLLYAERRLQGENRERYEPIWADLINRVQGLATVHDLLSASEWEPLPLAEVADQVISAALKSLPSDKDVVVEVARSPLLVASGEVNKLGPIFNELATNTAKYALDERRRARISVAIGTVDGGVEVEYRDDGPGYPDDVLRQERQRGGLYLIRAMADGLRGEVELRNQGGAVTVVRFPAPERPPEKVRSE